MRTGVVVVIFGLTCFLSTSQAFFFGNTKKHQSSRPHYTQPFQQVQSSAPVSHETPAIDIEDGYGAPAAPVLSAAPSNIEYQAPAESYSAAPAAPAEYSAAPAVPAETYSAPAKVKKSIPSHEIPQYEEEIDGYGSPVAPVIGASSSEPVESYAPPPPAYHKRPMKQMYRKKKMFNILDYMPMMNLLMMATSSRKPKRHISYQSNKNRHLRMPTFRVPKFRMPRFRMPRPPKISFGTKNPVKSYSKPIENTIKLDYAGWKPIEASGYSPQAPSSYQEPKHQETEIITIENAHRHPKKYEVPALPTGTYAPEPITAKPGYTEARPSVVYGKPEIAYEIPQATYEPQHPPAPIEDPIFESAPVQDLTSLAAVGEEYEQPVYSGYSQVHPGSYQSTQYSNHLAQEVQSGSVYVQNPTVSYEPEDQDLQYIFEQPQYAGEQYTSQPQYAGGPGTSSASFNIHVNGQSHGFSHNLDHHLKT